MTPGHDEVGLVAMGGNIPIGYYNDPEKTRRTFRVIDGTRYSVPGDYATVAADGTVQLLGRGSACINTGGEKVYPEEVEPVLRKHRGVFDCAVVGVPDPRFGEKVVALVQVTDGHHLDAAELTAWCRRKLAGYKMPREWLFVDALPRSPGGQGRPPEAAGARDGAPRHRAARLTAVDDAVRRRVRAARRPSAWRRVPPAPPRRLRSERVRTVAPGALGVVERGVGGRHQPLAVDRVVGHGRHAGADGDRRRPTCGA